MNQVLVAGLGNIFASDDGFGVVVAQRMASRPHPPNVRVLDIGERSAELADALQDHYDAAVLVNSMSRGGTPGTIYVVDPKLPDAQPGDAAASVAVPGFELTHDFDQNELLRMIGNSPGRRCRRILIVGCEPDTVGDPHVGARGLSAIVSDAADRAVDVVDRIAAQLAGDTA